MVATGKARKPKFGVQSGANELVRLADAWNTFAADHLPYQVLLLGKLLDRATGKALRDNWNLTLAEWRVIAELAVHGSATVVQLSESAWVDRAEVSRAAASLEARGYIERSDNPNNRRSRFLLCTPAGQQLFEQIRTTRRDFFQEIMQSLSPAEIESCSQWLYAIARATLTVGAK